MAIHRVVHLNPGLTGIVARIELLVEPGQPRSYWDGEAGNFVADPSVRLAAIPDADLPGLYLFQVPSTQSVHWDNALYRITVLNPAVAGDDKIVAGPDDFLVVDGDDSLLVPTATFPILGGSVTIWGAELNLPNPS